MCFLCFFCFCNFFCFGIEIMIFIIDDVIVLVDKIEVVIGSFYVFVLIWDDVVCCKLRDVVFKLSFVLEMYNDVIYRIVYLVC